MSQRAYTALGAGTSYQLASRFGGDTTVVVSAHEGDVWISASSTFSVPTDWATSPSTLPAFRIAEGQVVTFRAESEELLYAAARPDIDCRYSVWTSGD